MSAFRQQIQVFIDHNLSPASNEQRLRDTAKSQLSDLLASGRASPVYNTVVDGRPGGSIDQAHKSVYIEFVYLSTAAAFALGFLQGRSPKDTGTFASSFWVSVDDHYYAPGAYDLKSIGTAKEVTIGNTQPYNRKIDVQLVGNKTLHFSEPAGIYDDAVRAVRAKFRGTVTAKRVYDYDFPGKYRQKRSGYRFQSPAIILSVVS